MMSYQHACMRWIFGVASKGGMIKSLFSGSWSRAGGRSPAFGAGLIVNAHLVPAAAASRVQPSPVNLRKLAKDGAIFAARLDTRPELLNLIG